MHDWGMPAPEPPDGWTEVRADQIRRGDTVRGIGVVRKTQMMASVFGSAAMGGLYLGTPTWTRICYEGREQHVDYMHDDSFQIRPRCEITDRSRRGAGLG